MGNKKRSHPPRSKPPRTEDRAVVDSGVSSSNVNLTDDLCQEQSKIDPHHPANAQIRLECERAITAVQRGNHAKALRISKDLCLRYEDYAFVHRVQGYVHCQQASLIDDNVTKQRHLKNAVESARRAVTLSPNSIEFASFYATLLYQLSSDGKGYEESARECERALSIDNPIDPGKEFFQEASQLKVATAEERIANLRDALQLLVQRCRIGSSSTSMENLETRRPVEIKKTIKTLEERRSEIEVQVAAARVLQQYLDSMQMGLDVNADNNKLNERKKFAALKKIMPSLMRMGEFRSYWNTMSDEKKRGLLELRIPDLREHFSSFEDGLGAKTFSEAIGFAQKNKTWKFWSCFFCDEKFKDSELQMLHIEQVHKKDISSKLPQVMPEEVDANWADMLVNCTWKPVDTLRAVKIFEKQLEGLLDTVDDHLQGCNDDNESCLKEDDCNSSCQEDKAQFSYKEQNKGQVCSGSESSSHDDISKLHLGESVGNLQLMEFPDDLKWPLSDDVERAKIIERIHAEFQMLLRHKCLSKGNLKELINDTIEELQNFIPKSQIRFLGLDQTPLCICFMEEPYLKNILRFLHFLSNSFGLRRNPDKHSSVDDVFNVYEGKEVKERIVFNGDSSCLLLDERLLRGELMPHNYDDAVADDGSAITCTICHDEVDVLPDSDDLMHWLFSGLSIGEELASWTNIQDSTKHKGVNIIQTFEKEFDLLETWHCRKSKLLSHKEALQAVENICMEELEKREEQAAKHIPKSYASLLRRRQDEIVGEDNDAMSCSSRFELDAISSILKEALTGISSLRSSDHEHQEDDCIRTAIQRQIQESSAELSKIEAMIVRGFTVTQQLGVKFMQASSHDYRSIMLPLLMSFMRVQYEASVNEEAKQKSDAAAEAFLSELARDAKKNISKGGSNTKLPHENSKAKKKNKSYRKVKDSKATCGDKLYVVQEENEEQVHYPVGYDGDYPSSELLVAVSADELGLQEEELKHEIEHEVEERKLEEMLEYQKQIEEEAKQKNLAKQNKNAVAPITEDLEKMDVACSTLNDDSDPGVPVSTLEETKAPNNPWTIKRTRRRRSRIHGKGRQGTLVAQENLPSTMSQGLPSKVSSEEELRVRSTDFTFGNISLSDIFGAGLTNDVGKNNCLLNVIVQSLWHLRKFRYSFLSRSTSMHVHIGDPCVVCALYETFNALSATSANMPKEAVSPTNLQIALINLHPYGNLFQEIKDAYKVLNAILDFLHQSFTSGSDVSDTESEGSNCTGFWDCSSDACIAHTIFGMNIFQKMNCNNCGIESERMKFSYFFHTVRAITLRGMKCDYAESPFDELLKHAKMHCYRICDPEVGGCGKLNNLHHILSTPPHVFTTVLGWESTSESVDDISATLKALTTEIDLGVIYGGLDLGKIHSLVSMVCYYQQHYICFVYSHEHEKWIMYDDEILQVIGGWDDVLTMCEKGYLQPEVLFFEAVK